MVDLDYQQQVPSPSHTGGGEGSLRGGWGSGLQNPPALPSNSLASPRLLLIGTVHGDPLGYERALKLLRRFKPDLVTVEVSRFSLRYRQRQGPHWQRLLEGPWKTCR